jgi:hypothetical protein
MLPSLEDMLPEGSLEFGNFPAPFSNAAAPVQLPANAIPVNPPAHLQPVATGGAVSSSHLIRDVLEPMAVSSTYSGHEQQAHESVNAVSSREKSSDPSNKGSDSTTAEVSLPWILCTSAFCRFALQMAMIAGVMC